VSLFYREATAADLDALCTIDGTGWSRTQFEAELGKGLFVSGSLTGFATLRVVADEAQLYMIGVAKDQRRAGLGRSLMEECFRRARASGCKTMTLEVSSQNSAAVALYESLGFFVVGRRPKYYNDGADALLMDATL